MKFLLVMLLLLPGVVLAQSEPPPKLFIVSPSPGEVVLGDKVNVEVQTPSDAAGRLLIWLDAVPPYSEALSVDVTTAKKHTFDNVFSGLHTIYAEMGVMKTSVDFETIGQAMIKPATGDSVSVPVESSSGMFLPNDGASTAAVVIIVGVVMAILWRIFKKKP